MISNVIKEMEKAEKLNISGYEKKQMVLEKFKKELGDYYHYNAYIIASTIDFIATISKNSLVTSINNK